MRRITKLFGILMATAMAVAMTACGGTATVEEKTPEPVAEQKQETVVNNNEEEVSSVDTLAETQESGSQDSTTPDVTFTGPVEFTIAAVGGMYFDDTIISAAKDAGGYNYLFEDAKGQTKLEKEQEDFYNRLGAAGAQLVLCSGIKDFMFTTDKMDFSNGIYGRYFASLGSFIASETDTASLIGIKVKIYETGFVDTITERLDAKAFYIDSNDHYKLVPLNANDATNDVYLESVRTFTEMIYGSRNEIN